MQEETRKRIKQLALTMAQRIVEQRKAKDREDGLTAEDHAMFERVFKQIEYEDRYGYERVIPTQPHFALVPGWVPNQRTVLQAHRTTKLGNGEKSDKRTLPKLVQRNKV